MGATGYAGGDPNKVNVAGDTMTGELLLPGDPVDEHGAADREFVEDYVSGHAGSGGVALTSPAGTITVGGTSTAPTVDVLAIGQSLVTGLTAALAANTSAIGAETTRAETAEQALYTKPGTGIPAADLASAVQTLLTAAGSAYQKPAGGVPESDLSSAVQTLLTAAGNAAPAASPALTGTPTAPTAAALTNSTVLATTAYTDTAVAVEKTRAQTSEAGKPSAAGGTASTGPGVPYAHRSDTLANWISNNPVLGAGEGGYETDFAGFKIGNGSAPWAQLPYVRTPGVWTASSSGLVAATGDGQLIPSQGPPTTGRPMFFPVRIDQYATISDLITGFVGTVTPTLPTGSFLAMYACPGAPGTAGGALLGATADFSASVNVPQAELVLPIASNAAGAASSIPAQPIGSWVYLMLLTSYTGSASASAQYVAGRLFGTNLDGLVVGVTPRVYTNSSGSTMSTPPLSVPTLAQSNSNVISWVCAK